MAYIELSSRTSSSLKVYLAGLDSSYTGTKRNVKWYANGTLKNSTTINNGITQSPTVTLSGLSASTRYTIKCVISNIQGMSSGVTLTEKFWTKDPTPTISSFTVSQTSTGVKKARCSWRCSNLISEAYYEITVSGWEKASGTASTSGSKTISLDNFGRYTAKLTVWNGDESASKSCSFTLYDYDVTPTNISTARINGGLKFSWSGGDDATSYQVKLVKGYNTSDTQIKTTSGTTATFTGLEYGVKYIVYVKGYNLTKDSGWQFGYDVTTAPAQPRFSTSVKSGIITVNYSLASTSNLTSLYINLYDSTNTTVLQRRILSSPSGSFSYNKVDDGKYYIRAQSMFKINSSEIFCVDSSGDRYTLSKTVTVNSKPSAFSWTYTKKQDGNFNLTATEWNDFTSKINEFRDWKRLSNYSFTSAVKGNTFTDTMFNQAVTAINAMYSNTPLSSVSKGNTVTAYILNNIVSVLNNVPE